MKAVRVQSVKAPSTCSATRQFSIAMRKCALAYAGIRMDRWEYQWRLFPSPDPRLMMSRGAEAGEENRDWRPSDPTTESASRCSSCSVRVLIMQRTREGGGGGGGGGGRGPRARPREIKAEKRRRTPDVSRAPDFAT
jgi:DNA-directed RNA polymerase subunit RPC12/RpoP